MFEMFVCALFKLLLRWHDDFDNFVYQNFRRIPRYITEYEKCIAIDEYESRNNDSNFLVVVSQSMFIIVVLG